MRGVLANVTMAFEAGGKVFDDNEFVGADQAQHSKASRELQSLMASCAGSEAAKIVRSVAGLDGVGARLSKAGSDANLVKEKWKKNDGARR